MINGTTGGIVHANGSSFSLHVGLNSVDPRHYGGWSGELAGCENDARAMARVAANAGFHSPLVLLTKDATAAHVLGTLRNYCQIAKPGDTILWTNSSHGGQIPDLNGDESDRADETICAYDREIIDDELAAVWALAKPGVRILTVSDSCHSGTVVRLLPTIGNMSRRSREMPPSVARSTYEQNRDVYDPILKDPKLREYRWQIQASVLHIGACMDNQLSYDGEQNGLFTEKLLKVLKLAPKSYGDLVARVRRLMPSDQTPEFRYAGPRCPAFEASAPFSL
jgi:hypothetical protein